MKLLAKLSIKNKFVVIVLIIVSIITFLVEVIDFYIEKKQSIENAINNTLLDAYLVSDYCIVPLEFDDKIAAKNTLEKIKSKPNIKNAWLYTPTFDLFASYGEVGNVKPNHINLLSNSNYKIANNYIYVKNPVTYNNKLYGYLFLKSDPQIYELSKRRIIYSILLFLLMILFSFLLSSFFQKYITIPILKLKQFTKNISKTSDYSKRIKKNTFDEVGDLYQEFNNMLNVIEKAHSELKMHQNTLEDLVIKRTEELIKAKNDAEKANKTKSEFLSNMSHELRTPLNGIMGYAQILKTVGKLTHVQTKQVDIIHSSGLHLLSLINEILDYSKIEAKKLELLEKPFSLTNLLHHVLNIIKVRAEQKDLSLEYIKTENLPNFVFGDEIKIRQILINLLSNAVKYTNTGKITLNVDYFKPSKLLLIKVEDTGVGIPKAKLKSIFEPFTQVENQDKFIEGTGLGLAITQKLVELMNGTLTVESIVNQGSIFCASIEINESDSIQIKKKKHRPIRGYLGKRIKVLTVDDNLTNLSVIISALEPLGFEIITAQNGKQGVNQAVIHKPDLILMDLVMPVMMGNEAILKIKELTYIKAKIIGLTASVIERAERIEFIKNCNAIVDKPIDIDELLDTIKNQLNIEWIEEKLEEEKKHITAIESFPEKEVLINIINLVEMGDYSSTQSLINKLLRANKNMESFVNQINEYIEQYNSEKLIHYIKSKL